MHYSIPELCTWTVLLWSRVISLLSSASIKGTWSSSCKARPHTSPDPTDDALEKRPGSLCRKMCASLEHGAGCGFMEAESYFNPEDFGGAKFVAHFQDLCETIKHAHLWAFFAPSKLTFQLPKGFLGKESACQGRRYGLDPWVGKIPGGGNDNSLQYSWLGNPIDRGVWWATAHGVAKNQTWLSDWAHISSLLSSSAKAFIFAFCVNVVLLVTSIPFVE